jgi:tetratricopeptide (TPR) repeat protein
MAILARSLDKMVKPEYVHHVQTVLTRDMFWNSRLALVALIAAELLYYSMLVLDSDIYKHLPWFLAVAGVSIPFASFLFLGEEWIKNIARRAWVLNGAIAVGATVIGAALFFQVPVIKDPTIKMTVFSLMIGIVGAAAFTFACNPYTYLFFSVPFLGPITFHFFALDGSLGAVTLGGLAIPYVGLLTFLCLKDYERRVALINSELTVLEEKEQVVTASRELKASLDLVNALKTQQDGDYYLTSLLLNPLGVNAVDEGYNIDVDFLTKQKKHFEFKHHKRSIGGDISIAHTLHFASGPVTVFLNADAMGKSMQGAGGSLVLGAVFQSIIERTRLTTGVESEAWLKNVFLELQKVFESFDCSMLVSIYLAVLENNTGMFFYLNAEHPWGVLYRDGKAIFLQNRSYYRKLGTPGLQDEISVDHMQLQPNDVIILGSDGRDDIALPGHEGGIRVINEDESLFLRHVETADGRLKEIFDLITASGEITDDFSLVRVKYNPPQAAKAAREAKQTASALLREAKQLVDAARNSDAAALLRRAYNSVTAGPRALRAALNLAMQIKEYSLATNVAEKLLKLQPDDTEVLYLTAFAEKKLNRMDKALFYAEKIRSVDPNPNIMNLNLLAEIYVGRQEHAKANSVLDEILTIDPLNTRACRIREEMPPA